MVGVVEVGEAGAVGWEVHDIIIKRLLLSCFTAIIDADTHADYDAIIVAAIFIGSITFLRFTFAFFAVPSFIYIDCLLIIIIIDITPLRHYADAMLIITLIILFCYVDVITLMIIKGHEKRSGQEKVSRARSAAGGLRVGGTRGRQAVRC